MSKIEKLILPGSPLIVCPELVSRLKESGIKRYATDAAVFVQQLHYFLSMPNHGRVIDGIKWVYNSLTKWQSSIKWLTDYTFRTIKNKLVELGIIKAKQLGLNDQGRDRSYWYSINYDHEILKVETAPFSTDAIIQQSSDANQAINLHPIIEQSSNDIAPDITPENTNKINNNKTDVVAFKKLSEEKEEILLLIKSELDVSEISDGCLKLVKNNPAEVVISAISYVKEKMSNGGVGSAIAYLTAAVKNNYSSKKPKSKRQEEFDDAYSQLKAAGIVKDVPISHLNILMGETLVCVIDSSEQGYYWLPWRDAMSML